MRSLRKTEIEKAMGVLILSGGVLIVGIGIASSFLMGLGLGAGWVALLKVLTL